MKLVIAESIGVKENIIKDLANQILPKSVEVKYYNSLAKNDEEKIQRCQNADMVIIANRPYRENVLMNCKKLKMLSVAFTGVDHVAIDYCHQQNITVSNCSGYANEAVSELVMGMCISLYRKLAECAIATKTQQTSMGLRGLELSGKKFGIIGAGAIGLKTAKLAQAFGCEVYCYRRNPPLISDFHFVDMDTILRECDIISLHMPLTTKTKGMISAEKIALMKKNAILINTARGGVIDTQALATALNEGKIAGAGIDVFDVEPPISQENPLLTAKNIVLTPHIGFDTQEAMQKRAIIALENVAKWLEHQPQNIV